MRRVWRLLLVLSAALLLAALAALGEAHWEMRRLAPELPDPEALDALARLADTPVRVAYVETATQAGVRGGTLTHPAFVLEWADGRRFVIDTGMDRAGALAFGRPFELLLGAEPCVPRGSVAEQLGAAAGRVAGVAFTHLHHDHTGGLASLCAARDTQLPVFQTARQAQLGNYTTRPGRAQLEAAGCARFVQLGPGPLAAVPGFPGLAAIVAGGHTPGSTIWVASVAGTTWVFSGDITNRRQALLENRPKERFYSLFVVPEAPAHLETLRRWLAALDARPGFHVVVSHDHDALLASGLQPLGAQGEAE